MYNSGDAAEQVVRISLEGTEVALKLTGSAAKNIAAMLYALHRKPAEWFACDLNRRHFFFAVMLSDI